MAKLKTTNEALARFRNAAQGYIRTHPDRSRFHYALEKSLKSTQVAFEDYGDAESDIRAETALQVAGKFEYMDVGTPMNPQKMLVVDPTKAKDLQRRLRANGRKEIEVEIYKVNPNDVPKDLEASWIAEFVGFIMDDPEDKEEAKEVVMEAELSK